MAASVSLCIATYKRPEGLATLLAGIAQLEFENVELPVIEVVVVDNDASGSARQYCEQMTSQSKWPISYHIEPQQGVTFARNRAIQNTSSDTDFIAFIDDDEVPDRLWLDSLLHMQESYQADIVTGPVYPIFEAQQETPDWVKNGGFFNPPNRKNGDYIHIAYTHNVLIKRECLSKLDTLFDNDFAFKGSEDVHLFMRLHKAGAKIVWASDAVVHEIIPPERTTLRWLLARSYYGWSSHSLLEKKIFPSLSLQAVRLLKGIALIAIGLSTLPISLLKGGYHRANALMYMCKGFGTLSGLLNIQGAWGGANR